jgi:hypothetical protein
MEARFVRHRAPDTYAARRYREGVKSWRRGTRPYLWGVFGPIALSSFVIGVLSHDHAIFLVGFLGGGAAGAMIALRDQPPTYLQTWGDGAAGERRTHNALRSLGWHLVDDVDTGRGNYDHLLVGPAGVFMIETKNLTGVAEVEGLVPLLRRRHDPRGREQKLAHLPRNAREAGRDLSREIGRRTGRSVWVQAVVVFWNEFPQEHVEAGRVLYVHGSRIAELLRKREQGLAPNRIAEIADVLDQLKREGQTPSRAV